MDHKHAEGRNLSPDRRRWTALIPVIAGLMIAGAATTAMPQAAWDLSVGTGLAVTNVYVGSNDLYPSPLVDFKATYRRDGLSCYVSLLEGAGVQYVNPQRRLFGSLVVNQGDRRLRDDYSLIGFDVAHSDRTHRLLEGTPDLTSPVMTQATVGYLAPFGLVAFAVGHHPTTIEPFQATEEDRVRHGLIYSLQYMVARPLSQTTMVSGLVAVDVMDRTYADAWYSVEQATASLGVFAARGGLRDAMIAVQVDRRIMPRVDLSLVLASTILLGDAKRSPYTVDSHQRTVSLQINYGL
jgi:outer membrane scaffolding protein for murein synthesis (MipA/OmpV family)